MDFVEMALTRVTRRHTQGTVPGPQHGSLWKRATIEFTLLNSATGGTAIEHCEYTHKLTAL